MFYIETQNSAGNRTNAHFETVWGVQITRELNRIGEIRFTLPADAWASAGISFGTDYLVYEGSMLPPYDAANGLVGIFRHRSATLDADGQTVQIVAVDQMRELADRIVGFRVAYTQSNGLNSLFAILDDLADRAGWTIIREAGLGDAEISAEFFGESYLTAFNTLRQYVRGWFSLGVASRQLRFGRFQNFGTYETLYLQSDNNGIPVDTVFGVAHYLGEASTYSLSDVGAFLTNPPLLSDRTKNEMRLQTGGPMSPEWTVRSGVITKLTRIVDETPIVTRIYVLGAGVGTTQVNLGHATLTGGTYAVQEVVGPDGLSSYYIENPTAVSNYGIIERVLAFNDVRPITNSDADMAEAGNTLYALGVSFLNKFSIPNTVYDLEAVGIPEARPGDLILVDFRGVVHTSAGAVSTVNIDRQAFYITRISASFSDGGARYTLTISSTGEEAATIDSIVEQTIRELDRFKAHPQLSITYFHKASPTLNLSNEEVVDFDFDIGPEALAANSLTLEFHLMPLRSLASVTESSGEVTDSETTDAGAVIRSSAGGGDVANTNVAGGGDLSNDNTAIAQRNLASARSGSSDSLYHDHSQTLQNAVPLSTSSLFVYDVGGGEVGLAVFGGLVGKALRLRSITSPADGLYAHTHPIGNHNHGVSLPAHTHAINLPAHSHDVDIGNHTHAVNVPAHAHDLTFGVVEDTVTPSVVTVTVNGVAVASFTNLKTGSTLAGSVSGAGVFRCDILPIVLASSDWRERQHNIQFVCESGRGQVFAQLRGRLTIQPIKVVE